MVLLIQYICNCFNFKENTLYTAVGIMDRYLVNLVIRNEKQPAEFDCLAVTSVFLAAKIE